MKILKKVKKPTKFAKVIKMPYLCTNKNLILLYGTENKEI